MASGASFICGQYPDQASRERHAGVTRRLKSPQAFYESRRSVKIMVSIPSPATIKPRRCRQPEHAIVPFLMHVAGEQLKSRADQLLHGLCVATPVDAKSEVLRDTTVSPATSAVAPMNPAM